MGKLIGEKEIIEKNIERHLERMSSEYTRFLESTPTFVTYYQRATVGSTYDRGLENVERDLGKESANMFNRVESFAMYGIESLSVSLQREENGLDTQIDGEAVILPGTLRPYPDDFFTIDYVGKSYLFKVTAAANDTLRSKPFWKIQFTFFRIVEGEQAFQDQIDGEYVMIFDNIGTENRPVVKKDEFMAADYAERLYSKIREAFVKYFYDPQLNAITLNAGSARLYSRHLNRFLLQNELLSVGREYMNGIHLVEFIPDDAAAFELYRKTVYSALEIQDASELAGEFAFPIAIRGAYTPFAHNHVEVSDITFVEAETATTVAVFPQGFVGRLKIDQIYRDDIHAVENLVIDFVYGRAAQPATELLDAVNKTQFGPTAWTYAMAPLLLYILRDFRNKLIRNI